MGSRRIAVLRSLSNDDSRPETPQLRGIKPDAKFLGLMKAVQAESVEGVREQLAAGLSVNHREPALRSKTPLICAAEYGFLEAVVELLAVGASVSLADDTGATPLHMAAGGGHVSTVRLLLAHGAHVDPLDTHSSTPLHYAARADPQESGCCSVAGVVEMLVAAGARCALRDGEGRLPIHNAATAGNAPLLKVLAAGKYKATINLKDNEGRSPLHCAVLGARSLTAVSELLRLGVNIDARNAHGHTALHMAAGRHVNHIDEEFDGACLEQLLCNGASVTARTDDGDNALSLALQRTMWWGRPGARDHILHAVHQLVAKGSSIQEGFAMWRMVESFPSLVPTALNRSFNVNTSSRDSPYIRLEVDFSPLLVIPKRLQLLHRQSPLVPQSELPPPLLQDSEVAMLHYIMWEGRKQLFLHPLCHSFLHLKWLKVRKYFLANVLFYLLFVLSLTGFLLASKNCQDVVTNDTNTTTSSPTDSDRKCRWAGQEDEVVGLTWWCLVIFSALLDLREMVQLIQNPLFYLQTLANLLDAALVFSVPQLLVVGGTSSGSGVCCLDPWQQRVGAVCLILAWVRFMMFTGQFPSCGVYVVMFSTVATNVLRFLAMYVFVLIAFALAFYVLLRGLPTFANVPTSLITALVMMTGELDYESTFLSDAASESLGLTLIMLVVFIVLVYIILSNLLVGLAVSDMYSIRQRSEVLRLTRHVQLMVQVEALFRSRLIPSCLHGYLLNSIAITDTKHFPSITIYPNHSNGLADSLFLLLARTVGGERLLKKLFEAVISGFIPPDPQPPLPRKLVASILDVALREYELDKRERHLQSRTMQQGVPGQIKTQMPSHLPPPPSPATLARCPSISRLVPDVTRASWRRTFHSDTDWEDDPTDAQQGMTGYQVPLHLRVVTTDNNSSRLEELRMLVVSLQATVESLALTVHQQQTYPHTNTSLHHVPSHLSHSHPPHTYIPPHPPHTYIPPHPPYTRTRYIHRLHSSPAAPALASTTAQIAAIRSSTPMPSYTSAKLPTTVIATSTSATITHPRQTHPPSRTPTPVSQSSSLPQDQKSVSQHTSLPPQHNLPTTV